MKLKTLTVLLLLVFLASFLLQITTVSARSKESMREWTFMVYLDADNNLDPAGFDDLNEMELVGSTSEVAIIVLFDGRDVEDSKIYYIEQDADLTTITSVVIKDLGEVNMGDPDTLRNFIKYSTTRYRSQRYALVLWDHGDNWFGVCWDEHPVYMDNLTPDEIQQALDGFVINLVGFDACLMASVEVAYEIRGGANVMVASQDYVPWEGWPYHMVLEDLVTDPGMDEVEFGSMIVDDYMDFYKHTYWRNGVTLAAIDLRSLGTLVDDIASLTDILTIDFKEYKDAVTDAKNSADRYWFGFWKSGPYIDLHHFVSKLGETAEDLTQFTDPILNDLEAPGFIIKAKCYPGPHIHHGFGLTIYFPRNRNLFYYPGDYQHIDFAQATDWWVLLELYFGKQ